MTIIRFVSFEVPLTNDTVIGIVKTVNDSEYLIE